jgi:hypothetical protein
MTEDAHDGEYLPKNPDEGPADVVSEDEDLSAEGLLKYSQGIRKNFVKGITKTGIPQDKDERGQLLQALRDMDQTSVNRMKLDVDKENSANSKKVQEIVERMFQMNPRGLAVDPGHESHHLPEPDVRDIPDVDLEDGETEIGLRQESSKDFLNRMESK